MISAINGTIKAVKEQAIVVDVGALALQIAVPQESFFQIGNQISLATYMHWNQEQGPSLFGFNSELERAVFLIIIDCSGIGPKIGLAILGSLGAERFIEVVQAGDEKALSKVNGIGPKKAEQMIVQLKHKVAKLLDSGVKISGSAQITQWQNIQEVLESLNYSRTEIAVAMKQLRESTHEVQLPFDQLMRRALGYLAKK
jgi:Holliday junction DNA helicase RuvA